MIKLKDILLENDGEELDILVPRRTEDRLERMIRTYERMIRTYIRNGNKGDLNLQDLELTVLPEMIKDISVDGDFYCGNNRLTSLINSPKYVTGNFGCSNNRLTSLEHAPKFVGGTFYCRLNPGKFTEKQVRAVCDVKGDILT